MACGPGADGLVLVLDAGHDEQNASGRNQSAQLVQFPAQGGRDLDLNHEERSPWELAKDGF